MHRHFEDQLNELRSNMIKMGSLVDEQLDDSMKALHMGDMELVSRIFEKERKINEFDNLIDQEVDDIIALEQPVAADLRLVVAALKMNHELERIGDVAVNIAQRVQPLINFKDLVQRTEILEMGNIARQMVKESLDAFIHGDANLARAICKKDDVVDEMNRQKFRYVVSEMKRDHTLIEPGAHLIVALKHIERLADHATNIAEDVVFLVDAKVIKHHASEEK
ncbi:MAG: phosphate signaling complex protein PhoU [Candidatus Kryptoniota bacterium]